MKFLHLGDLHLGKSLGEYDLIDDQRYILDQILDDIRKEKISLSEFDNAKRGFPGKESEDIALLIAGDVFDKSIPSEAAVNLFDYFLGRLAEEKISTFVISGNHDSDDRLNFGSRFFENSRIYISAVFDGRMKPYRLTDAFGEIDVWLMPFVKASQVRHFYPDEKIENYEDAVRVILEHADIDEKRRNILVAHQFVVSEKGMDPHTAGSEGISVQSVGLVEKVGSGVFESFDYVALGHIHAPQKVGREEIRYAGSPLKYSLSEANSDKSVPVINMQEKGNIRISLLPLKPVRDLRHIKGPMKKLLDPENVTAPEDYIYATLTDDEPVSEVMGIFRQTYPNMVRLDYDNKHTRQIEQVDLSVIAVQQPFSVTIAEFYEKMYGCEISEEELKIMEQIAGKAGVANEAG